MYFFRYVWFTDWRVVSIGTKRVAEYINENWRRRVSQINEKRVDERINIGVRNIAFAVAAGYSFSYEDLKSCAYLTY